MDTGGQADAAVPMDVAGGQADATAPMPMDVAGGQANADETEDGDQADETEDGDPTDTDALELRTRIAAIHKEYLTIEVRSCSATSTIKGLATTIALTTWLKGYESYECHSTYIVIIYYVVSIY